VRRVGLEDFETVHRRLLSPLDSSIPPETWRRLFSYRWTGAEDYAGYGLFDNEEPVGFLGLLFSMRLVHGKQERFCNVTSWTVADSHRHQALTLLAPLMRLQDHTITNLTSTATVQAIFTRLGFRPLDTHVRVAWPLPRWRTPSGLLVESRTDVIAESVSADLRAVVEDHRPFAYQVLLRWGARVGLVVYTVGGRHGLRTARIHHVEDAELLGSALGPLQRFLAHRNRVRLVQMDGRLWPSPPPSWTTLSALPVPRLYRSKRLAPADVSNLYTEMVLLGL